MSLHKQNLNMKNRQLAELANSSVYLGILKPKLLKIKTLQQESRKEPENEFEALKESIKTITINKTIKEIIDFIEGAENKINSTYDQKR